VAASIQGRHTTLDNIGETAHTATMNSALYVLKDQPLSLTRRMQDMSKEQRRKVMAGAAEKLAEYYRTDPEIQEWQALDGEDFYNAGDDGSSEINVRTLFP